VTSVLLVGTGEVAVRAARQLLDTPGLDRLLVTGRDGSRAGDIAQALGRAVEAAPWPAAGDGGVPEGVDAVAIAVPVVPALEWATRAVRAGVPAAVVADTDDDVGALLALDADARRAGVVLAAGCGLVPGLGDVLARHAADAMDRADEVHVARTGAAGPACIDALKRARHERALEWHDGAWQTSRKVGPLLVWFPDPVGARECEVAAAGASVLLQAVPGAEHVTVRVDEPPVRSPTRALVTRKPLDAGWGAARVEVWGWRGNRRVPVVYGVIERTAVAAGTVLAVAAARLAGLLPAVTLRADPRAGARGLGALVEAAPFLAELARRGVKAATFEGVPVG
jgi:hypothetical protein